MALIARPASRTGFSLVELLVVAAVLAILIALLMPALGTAMGYARNLECQSNLNQIAKAALTYAADHKGSIVPLKYNNRYWCNILAYRWLPAENTASLPDSQPGRLASVLRCPAASEERVRIGLTAQFPDATVVQGWYRLPETASDQKVDCSYYWNGYDGGNAERLLRFPSVNVDTASSPQAKVDRIHDLSEIKQRPTLAMVMDGVLFYEEGKDPRPRIAARHSGARAGTRSRTNIAYYDGHVETLDRVAEENWSQDHIMKSESADLDTKGTPYFMLPYR